MLKWLPLLGRDEILTDQFAALVWLKKFDPSKVLKYMVVWYFRITVCLKDGFISVNQAQIDWLAVPKVYFGIMWLWIFDDISESLYIQKEIVIR